MAARGAASKESVANKILEMFPNAFRYEKEIRVPMEENGEIVQIKVTLTAAKNNVEVGGDTAMPGAETASFAATPAPAQLKQDAVHIAPTAAEEANVKSFLGMMGL